MSTAPMHPGQQFRVEVLLDFFSESMGGDARTLLLQHVSTLGAGAMGEVHRVDILRPGQAPLPAALKIALGDVVAHRAAIVREAHVLRARIQDGVAQFLALVELPDGGIGLIITFESGRPLEAILESGPLHPSDALALGRRLFGVLAALHADESDRADRATSELPQVVHGDIKPGNIIVPLDAQGRPDFHQATLIDFGVARLQQRLARAGASLTGEEVLGGTVGYMPVGHLTQGATSASDVFAVGVVLYECLTGRAPWTVPERDDTTPIAHVWALEEAMKSRPPARLLWRDVKPWRHTRGWNAFFAAVLANGDPARIPSAAQAVLRLDAVRKDRLFVYSVAVAVLAVAAAVGLWVRFVYCPSGLVRCDGACVDPARDLSNCGACGRHCAAGERCVDGSCALSCPRGELRCGASCVDTASDRLHCGACGNACAEGAVCARGACKATCGGTQQVCDGVCRDVEADRANCGACGHRCAAGQVCAHGSCVASCATGFSVCAGRCFDLQTERSHCGSCANACAAGQVCAHGRCVTSCTSDLTNCGGSCRDLRTDRANCGACGTACAAGEGCRAGRCVRECPPGLALCGDRCRDLEADGDNCGACGTRCADGDRCARGACAMSCGHGTTACGGACRDLARDHTSCGACGNACGAGERCEQGRCALSCPAASARCGDRCVSVTSDNEHCGRCDRRCANEETCRQGECRRIRPPRPVIPNPSAPMAPGVLQPVAPEVLQPAPPAVLQPIAPLAPATPVAPAPGQNPG